MAKLIFILTLMTGYVIGLQAFTHKAMAAEQRVAQFYTATGNPDQLLAASSK